MHNWSVVQMQPIMKPTLGKNTKRYLAELIDDLKAEDKSPKAKNKSEVVKEKLASTTLFAGKLTESSSYEADKKKSELPKDQKNGEKKN